MLTEKKKKVISIILFLCEDFSILIELQCVLNFYCYCYQYSYHCLQCIKTDFLKSGKKKKKKNVLLDYLIYENILTHLKTSNLIIIINRIVHLKMTIVRTDCLGHN